MKKLLALSFILAFLIIAFPSLKSGFASFLLVKQLTSDEEVAKIISQANDPFNPDPEAIFNNQRIDYLSRKEDLLTQINEIEKYKNVLGTGSERWIEIDLSEQRIYGWEGGNRVYNYLVSTGKWAPTPVGDYKIWIKLTKTTMSGGSKSLGTYYYLPNVPCTMYFYKGYGIHGAYWHNNFGQPMSHGCVNMKPDESCALFNWASVGTRVNIHQ